MTHGLGIKLDKRHAWHFVGKKLRDGSPIPKDGKPLVYTGELKLCVSGLHFSRQPFDALQYAQEATLCLVEVGGTVVEPAGEEKGICTIRTIVARMDATELLRYFARMQALSVIHLWHEAPEIVCEYLMTGDESLRSAAESAAVEAERSAAARSAAWSAAGSAWSAAGSAEKSAARSAERDAARQSFNELVYESFGVEP